MPPSTAAAIWIDRTGLDVDTLLRLIEDAEPLVASAYLVLEVFERTEPSATLVRAALDDTDVDEAEVFVSAPAVLARRLDTRTWRIGGHAGPAGSTHITAFDTDGRREWDTRDSNDSGVTRLAQSAGAAGAGLTFHIRPYLDPDVCWVPKATRRAGVPQVPWKSSLTRVETLQATIGAALPFAPGPSFHREREFLRLRETQLVAKLPEHTDAAAALDLLGPAWLPLDVLPPYALDPAETHALLSSGARPASMRLTARETDCVMSVVMDVPRGPTWLVLTIIHAPPPPGVRAAIARRRANG